MNFSAIPLAGLLPGGGEWLWILIIILLLFGSAKLPALARGLGQSIKEFKKAQRDNQDEKSSGEAQKTEPTKPSPPNQTGQN